MRTLLVYPLVQDFCITTLRQFIQALSLQVGLSGSYCIIIFHHTLIILYVCTRVCVHARVLFLFYKVLVLIILLSKLCV